MWRAMLLCLVLAGAAQAQTVTEEAGTWRLTCVTDRMTDRSQCLLRHRDWVERAAVGASLGLEILERDRLLLPAVTARDLSLDSLPRGLLAFTGTAQLRFDRHPMMELPCALEGRHLVCLPRRQDRDRAAAELLTAGSVLVRMAGLGSQGGAAAEPTELRLSGTGSAAALLRRHQPAGTAPPPEPPAFDLRDWLGRLQRLLP